MAPKGRKLKANPSHTDDVSAVQKELASCVDELHQYLNEAHNYTQTLVCCFPTDRARQWEMMLHMLFGSPQLRIKSKPSSR